MSRIKLITLGLLILTTPVFAAELFVKADHPNGGDGSAARPFARIGDAVKAARGGDTITLSAGIYRESILLDKSGNKDRPTTLRAAQGQRVILSGFEPVSGWQPFRDHIVTTVVDGPVEELFAGLVTQPVARWPGTHKPWRYLNNIKAGDGTMLDRDGLASEPAIKEIAAKPAAARIYLYMARGNFFRDVPLTRLDLSTSQFATDQLKTLAGLTGDKNRYQITNHVSLITQPGQWACESAGEKKTRIYYWPPRPDDLKSTQVRRSPYLLRVGGYSGTGSHFRVEGLEVTGSAGPGIEILRAQHVEVTRCLVHHNSGTGITARRSGNLNLSKNISSANGGGISVASSHDVVVSRNEIALNSVDGLVIAGNVSGKPDGEPTTSNVLVKQNYIHGHLLLSHPDNMQTYRGVEKIIIEDNVFLWGGQGLMTEETNHGILRNNVIFGTGAVAVIFGHANASDWVIEGNTIGLGGWGALSLTAKNYQIHRNIFYHNPISLGETITSNHNLFTVVSQAQGVGIVSKPKWKRLATPADVAAATGQDRNSLLADPGFRNAPARQVPALWSDENTLSRLFVRQSNVATPTEGFAVGDQIEIDGDQVLRRVTAVDDKSISFDPPLPQLPLRSALIWNWKKATSAIPDLRPRDPKVTGSSDGKTIGSTLDIPSYRKGDFDGDGQRDLPEVPTEVQSAWPSPTAIVLPFHGS